MFKRQSLVASIGVAAVLLANPALEPVQALEWVLDNGTVVNTSPAKPIVGSFFVNDDAAPTVTSSNITVDNVEFTAIDVFNVSYDTGGIQAIDWQRGSNSLSLVFSQRLTSQGGTVGLNSAVSDYNGFPVSGSVEAVPEPITLLGSLAALGVGTAMEHRRRSRS
ncbi:MAG: PEP-CTERM sorting domain-containing protein [Cyanobacteriota bacterium]|nr:PEP-CTERM sorting domain-containing protein [Cyanobacteriota bacterium]